MKNTAMACAFLALFFFGTGAYGGSALIGVDFGPEGQRVPGNWTSVSGAGRYPALINEAGDATATGLEVVLLSGSELDSDDAVPDSDTIPVHANSLKNLNGNIFSLETGSELGLVFFGMDPGRSYKIWLFGLRSGTGYTQSVEVSGSGGVDSFKQTGGDSQLTVNGFVGRKAEDLFSYARIYTPSSSGEIGIWITSDEGYFLAGVAIQKVDHYDDDDGFSCFFSTSSH